MKTISEDTFGTLIHKEFPSLARKIYCKKPVYQTVDIETITKALKGSGWGIFRRGGTWEPDRGWQFNCFEQAYKLLTAVRSACAIRSDYQHPAALAVLSAEYDGVPHAYIVFVDHRGAVRFFEPHFLSKEVLKSVVKNPFDVVG